jgi:hypothetical protein
MRRHDTSFLRNTPLKTTLDAENLVFEAIAEALCAERAMNVDCLVVCLQLLILG